MENTPKYAMAYVLGRCIDCKACMIACKTDWSLPGNDFRTHIEEKEDAQSAVSGFRLLALPRQCNHCDKAPCVSVCPTKASHKREDGIVDINEARCVGCMYCIPSCPYNARYMNHEKGVADKCTFCRPRIEAGLLPTCVTTCPSSARVFGNINDPDSDITKVLKQAQRERLKISVLREDVGTSPNIYYIHS